MNQFIKVYTVYHSVCDFCQTAMPFLNEGLPNSKTDEFIWDFWFCMNKAQISLYTTVARNCILDYNWVDCDKSYTARNENVLSNKHNFATITLNTETVRPL